MNLAARSAGGTAFALTLVLTLGGAACAGPERSQPKVPEITSADSTGPRTETPGGTYSPQANGKPPPSESTPTANQGAYEANLAVDSLGRVVPASAAPAELTDDQILQVVHVANTGEVDQAKIAQAKAKSPRVKQFAAMMVHDHLDADAKGYELAKGLKLTPAESSLGTQLQNDGQRTLVELRAQNGAEFDRAYIDAQVIAHKDVLDAIDQKLLPGAKNNEVRTHLQTVRTKVESHLREARAIQGTLSVR